MTVCLFFPQVAKNHIFVIETISQASFFLQLVKVSVQPLLGNSASFARSRLISCWSSQFTFLLCYCFTLWPTGGLSNPAQPLRVRLVIHLIWSLVIKLSWYCIFMILLLTMKRWTELWVGTLACYRLELLIFHSALDKHFMWMRLYFTSPPPLLSAEVDGATL